MITLRYFLFVVLLLMLSTAASHAQTIWPGDINNNGVVNGVDLLYWGQAFGANGSPRAEASADWAPRAAPPAWTQNFRNGINFAYADCNGDGVVNEADLDDGIEDNYGLIQGTVSGDGFANAPAGSGAAPRIQLSADNNIVRPGEQINISLRIDDASRPIQNFYGLAFTMKYTAEYLQEDDGLDFELNENNWLHADGSYVEKLFADNEEEGTAMLAITRTNQEFVAVGTEELGSFSVVIEDIIISKEVDTIQIIIDSVLLITDGFRSLATEPTTFEIIVTENPDSLITSHEHIYNPLNTFDEVKAFPNPARNTFFIETPLQVNRLEIFNAMGQRVDFYIQESGELLYQIKLTSNLPAGLLFIRLHFKGQAITRRLFFQSD